MAFNGHLDVILENEEDILINVPLHEPGNSLNISDYSHCDYIVGSEKVNENSKALRKKCNILTSTSKVSETQEHNISKTGEINNIIDSFNDNLGELQHLLQSIDVLQDNVKEFEESVTNIPPNSNSSRIFKISGTSSNNDDVSKSLSNNNIDKTLKDTFSDSIVDNLVDVPGSSILVPDQSSDSNFKFGQHCSKTYSCCNSGDSKNQSGNSISDQTLMNEKLYKIENCLQEIFKAKTHRLVTSNSSKEIYSSGVLIGGKINKLASQLDKFKNGKIMAGGSCTHTGSTERSTGNINNKFNIRLGGRKKNTNRPHFPTPSSFNETFIKNSDTKIRLKLNNLHECNLGNNTITKGNETLEKIEQNLEPDKDNSLHDIDIALKKLECDEMSNCVETILDSSIKKTLWSFTDKNNCDIINEDIYDQFLSNKPIIKRQLNHSTIQNKKDMRNNIGIGDCHSSLKTNNDVLVGQENILRVTKSQMSGKALADNKKDKAVYKNIDEYNQLNPLGLKDVILKLNKLRNKMEKNIFDKEDTRPSKPTHWVHEDKNVLESKKRNLQIRNNRKFLVVKSKDNLQGSSGEDNVQENGDKDNLQENSDEDNLQEHSDEENLQENVNSNITKHFSQTVKGKGKSKISFLRRNKLLNLKTNCQKINETNSTHYKQKCHHLIRKLDLKSNISCRFNLAENVSQPFIHLSEIFPQKYPKVPFGSQSLQKPCLFKKQMSPYKTSCKLNSTSHNNLQKPIDDYRLYLDHKYLFPDEHYKEHMFDMYFQLAGINKRLEMSNSFSTHLTKSNNVSSDVLNYHYEEFDLYPRINNFNSVLSLCDDMLDSTCCHEFYHINNPFINCTDETKFNRYHRLFPSRYFTKNLHCNDNSGIQHCFRIISNCPSNSEQKTFNDSYYTTNNSFFTVNGNKIFKSRSPLGNSKHIHFQTDITDKENDLVQYEQVSGQNNFKFGEPNEFIDDMYGQNCEVIAEPDKSTKSGSGSLTEQSQLKKANIDNICHSSIREIDTVETNVKEALKTSNNSETQSDSECCLSESDKHVHDCTFNKKHSLSNLSVVFEMNEEEEQEMNAICSDKTSQNNGSEMHVKEAKILSSRSSIRLSNYPDEESTGLTPVSPESQMCFNLKNIPVDKKLNISLCNESTQSDSTTQTVDTLQATDELIPQNKHFSHTYLEELFKRELTKFINNPQMVALLNNPQNLKQSITTNSSELLVQHEKSSAVQCCKETTVLYHSQHKKPGDSKSKDRCNTTITPQHSNQSSVNRIYKIIICKKSSNKVINNNIEPKDLIKDTSEDMNSVNANTKQHGDDINLKNTNSVQKGHPNLSVKPEANIVLHISCEN